MLSQTMQQQFTGWSYNRPVAGLGDGGGSLKDPAFGSVDNRWSHSWSRQHDGSLPQNKLYQQGSKHLIWGWFTLQWHFAPLQQGHSLPSLSHSIVKDEAIIMALEGGMGNLFCSGMQKPEIWLLCCLFSFSSFAFFQTLIFIQQGCSSLLNLSVVRENWG